MERIEIDGPDVDMDEQQTLLYRGRPFTGEVVEHVDGRLRSLEGFVNGFPEGVSRFWHQNGALESEGVIKDGLPFGEWREWHSNGRLRRRDVWDGKGRRLSRQAWDEEGRPVEESDVPDDA